MVRRARADDIVAMMAIDTRSNPIPWSRMFFAAEVNRVEGLCLVATDGDAVVGFMATAGQGDAWHILNVTVDLGHRRRGIGALLVDATLAALDGRPYRRYTLEVRVSNEAAVRLYRTRRFVDSGIRPRYYSDDQEDALIMWREPEDDPS
ncbi:MAG: ribosomal-protein-alanine N-acetyltransferase [Thermoleophilia bacterium]|nr:ribosomal-protein-alanine N-acetyltransferase [Thermoleophilia bacterium]